MLCGGSSEIFLRWIVACASVVLSSDAIVVCGLGLGTLSEVALAYKYGTPTVLVAPAADTLALLGRLGAPSVYVAHTAQDAIALLKNFLDLEQTAAEG